MSATWMLFILRAVEHPYLLLFILLIAHISTLTNILTGAVMSIDVLHYCSFPCHAVHLTRAKSLWHPHLSFHRTAAWWMEQLRAKPEKTADDHRAAQTHKLKGWQLGFRLYYSTHFWKVMITAGLWDNSHKTPTVHLQGSSESSRERYWWDYTVSRSRERKEEIKPQKSEDNWSTDSTILCMQQQTDRPELYMKDSLFINKKTFEPFNSKKPV